MLPALATERSTSASLSTKQTNRNHRDPTEIAPRKEKQQHAKDRYLPLLLPSRYSAAALRQHPTPPHGIIIAANRARELWRANGGGDLPRRIISSSLLRQRYGKGGEGAKQRTGYQKRKRTRRHRKGGPRLSDKLTCGVPW